MRVPGLNVFPPAVISEIDPIWEVSNVTLMDLAISSFLAVNLLPPKIKN